MHIVILSVLQKILIHTSIIYAENLQNELT